jgi:AraC-like DNA-binding protein
MSELAVVNQRDPVERWEAWRHLISGAFVPLEPDVDDPRQFGGGALRLDRLGQVQVSEVSGDAQVVRRTRRSIAAADPEYYKLGVQVRGYCVLTQDGREAPLTPGDFAIYDTTRPYQLAFDERFRMLVVMFPRQLLSFTPDQMSRLTAVRVSGRQGLGALVSPFLTTMARQAEGLDARGAVRLSDNVLDLLTTVFAARLDRQGEIPVGSRRRVLFLQTQRYIETRLADPDLSPGTIAAAQHISTRYLHRLFEEAGTSVTAWIRTRRLEHARRDLADPAHGSASVSAVAARWGLVDASHFSRSFKEAYGQTPREYRSAHSPDGAVLRVDRAECAD